MVYLVGWLAGFGIAASALRTKPYKLFARINPQSPRARIFVWLRHKPTRVYK